MVNTETLKHLLKVLNFEEKEKIFSKHFPKTAAHIKVDFSDKGKIIYPQDLRVEGEFTTNFESAENCVVLECVDALLTLGYSSKHLTLEPKWKVGHGASGGRADIVIRDNGGDVFAIIECKTFGKEFDNAWKNFQNEPSQLFSYAQQEHSTRYICLYASHCIAAHIKREYYVVSLIDNENLLGVKTYKDANTAEERFKVWKETYDEEAFERGLFEDDSRPFEFGKKNYNIKDLQAISETDIQKKYHEFATILRKYNVSGRENAFDKLVNLFLCKVVDEKENPNDLKFYWKGKTHDTDFDLQDRLQKLYHQGMKQFLNEEVTYINEDDINSAFKYVQNDPDATKDTIHLYFKRLKFYTNNDFAFIDVHNERLFKENAKVLRGILQMLQNIKIKSGNGEQSNQFLGDMFEGFLDAGVKQSEGQFFTPMPIVKFIINSLPLEIIKNNEQLPKAIDYACGAGHFLTEIANQLLAFNSNQKAEVTGIEKEYRLSKVAKVSAFMYGQDDINIVYADALAHNPEIKEGAYQILVANPPYSVKGFLETLKKEEREAYELYQSVEEKSIVTNNSIETFFIERAKQLLAPGGIAGIILPSSILSNDNRLYKSTRELLLKYFHLVAITELGSGTFGKTGTNTVILFLKKRHSNPDAASHYANRAQSWIRGNVSPNESKNKTYKDLRLLDAYCKHIGLDAALYKNFLETHIPSEALQKTDLWQEYKRDFDNLTETKDLYKKRYFKDFSPEEQQRELAQRLHQHIRNTEQDKLYYYLLAQSNSTPVLVIKSPTDGKEMKKFLGYEWSIAKGNEGIKYLGAENISATEEDTPTLPKGLQSIKTPLYTPAKRDDQDKLNYYICKNFLGETKQIPKSLSVFAYYVSLVDMLDFSRKDFSTAISLSVKKEIVESITSKWEMKKLGEIAMLKGGNTFPKYYQGDEDDTKIPFIKVSDMNLPNNLSKIIIANNYVDKTILKNKIKATIHKKNSIIFPKVGKAIDTNKKRILAIDCAVDNNIMVVAIFDEKQNLPQYLYQYFLANINLLDIASKSNPPSISALNCREIKIPVPPLEIQQKIVDECEVIDRAAATAQHTIDHAKAEITRKVKETASKGEMKKLGDVCNVTAGQSPEGKFYNSIGSGLPFYQGKKEYGEKYISAPTTWTTQITKEAEAGDILMSVRAPVGPVNFATQKICIGRGLASIRVGKEIDKNFLFEILDRYKIEGNAGAIFNSINKSQIEKLKIPVPPLKVQQQLVKEVEALEAQIATAKAVIAAAPTKKRQALQKYL